MIYLRTFSSEDNPKKSSDNKNSYNFTESLQMLGLDESVETKDDSSTVQGAYLSYLHLRLLKIRDLQRTVKFKNLKIYYKTYLQCLSILNYFRSVERTLVINMNIISKKPTKTTKEFVF